MSAASALTGTEKFYADTGSDAYVTATQLRTFARSQAFKNVKEYGAVGDGVADDTAAIQAALDDHSGYYVSERDGTIYFPTGIYKITSPGVDWSRSAHCNLCLLGDNGTLITGNFAGTLFRRPTDGGITYTSVTIQGLSFVNSSNSSSACSLEIGNVLACSVRDCGFGIGTNGGSPAGVAVKCGGPISFTGCTWVGNGYFNSDVGILCGDTILIGCQFVGFGTAVRAAFTPTLAVYSCAFEVNGIAIEVGGNFTDPFFGHSSNEPGSAYIVGGHWESNSTHVKLSNGSALIQNMTASSFNANCDYGINGIGGSKLTMIDCNLGAANYNVAGIYLPLNGGSGFFPSQVTMERVVGASWSVYTEIDTTQWKFVDYTKAWVQNYLKYTPGVFPTVTPLTATIASGAVTVLGNYMTIDTEASAATDDLDTISGADHGTTGGRLVIRAANSARTVVVKNGTGNLKLAGSDFSLDNALDTIQLVWDGVLSQWLEISRCDNGA